MNDLAELKRFAVAHAIAQDLPAQHYDGVLGRITTDAGADPGSWAHEWSRAGDELAAAGQLLAASGYHVMARFPFVDGPGRRHALDRAVATFDGWRREQGGIEERTVELDGHPVRLWTAGLSTADRRPLLVLSGGIVSPKEQWAAVLPQIAAYGLAGVVTEFPGVGESPLRAHAGSWRIYPQLLDALAGEADVGSTRVLALSFSGLLALRAAGHDPRVRGVVLNGAPLRHFFIDRGWAPCVPRITRDTLAHLARVPPARVFAHVHDWALTDAELRAVEVPVAAVVARRDEIVPPADAELLWAGVADLRLLEHDDVHGAPAHLAHTRLWSLLAVLDQWPDADPEQRAGLAAAVAAVEASEASGVPS